MPAPDSILFPLGLDRLIDERGFARDATTGTLEHAAARVVGAPVEFLRSLRVVLEKESPGTWAAVLKSSGVAAGRAIATHLDVELARFAKPTLGALPLEACLALLERHLTAQGWGRVHLDGRDAADHGLVVARLEHSGFAEALSDVDDLVDPLLAGVLSGFFQHISGEPLGCEEIACVRRGAPCCVFVITAPERLAAILPLRAVESPDTIVAHLKT